MNQLFPHMTDSPEHSQSLGGLAYGIFPFVILPFTLMLFIIGVRDTGPYVILELLYQGINFIALFSVFRTYLQDSWFTFGLQARKNLGICLKSVLLILPYYILLLVCYLHNASDEAELLFMGTLPVTGIELTMLPGQLVRYGGILGAGFLVLLGPVTNSCMYYATAFAPLCANGRRIAAYLSVAALTAVPRIVTYFTIWGGWKEKELYLAQLPIHLFSCWLYQKCNTIWVPILTHGILNAVCCAALYGLHVFRFI